MPRSYARAARPLLLVALTLATAAWAFHTTLTKALPVVDGTVTAAPADVTLWFNEHPDLVLSNIRMMGPDSTSIPLGAPKAGTDSFAITSPVCGTMAAGKYTVSWRTAGPDGHVMHGKYQFTYQP